MAFTRPAAHPEQSCGLHAAAQGGGVKALGAQGCWLSWGGGVQGKVWAWAGQQVCPPEAALCSPPSPMPAGSVSHLGPQQLGLTPSRTSGSQALR